MAVSRTVLVSIIAAAVIVAGVGVYYLAVPPADGPQEGITLTIITRHDTTIWNIYTPAFLDTDVAKQLNVENVDWLQPDPGLWLATITSGQLDFDVAWGGGPPLFDELAREGLLDSLDTDSILAERQNIPETIAGASTWRTGASGETIWIGAAISTFGFTINEAFLEFHDLPSPETWTDLASPIYGKTLPTSSISMANSPDSTSNTRIYQIIIQAFGWEEGWSVLTRMAGNAGIYTGSVPTQTAVEIGEVGIAMSIDFYGFTSQLINEDTRYVVPEGGSIVNADPIALIKGSKHKEAAEAFIAFVLSQEGQSLWLREEVNRMPVRADAFETEIGQQRTDLREVYELTTETTGVEFSDDVAISYLYPLMAYFDATLTDTHDQLKFTWEEIVTSYLPEKCGQNCISDEQYNTLVGMLGAPVVWTDPETGEELSFTEGYAQDINEKMRTDPSFANVMVSLWRQAAIEKYSGVSEALQQMLG